MTASTPAIDSVLIMDDDPILCAVAESFFQTRGATKIWTAEDGKQALDLLYDRSQEFDFILTDLNMPKLDGVQFFRYMKKCKYDGPFAILSGEDQAVLRTAERLARSHDLNLVGALSKPFNPNELEGLLAALKPRSANGGASTNIRVTPNDVEAAIEAGQIVPYYQPKVDVPGGETKSAECLARWIHPKLGLIPPDVFIPIAEEYGLILKLTDAMLTRMIEDALVWDRYGIKVSYALNLSATILEDLDFPDHVANMIDSAGLQRTRFTFEITESQILHNKAAALEVVTRLRLLGFSISIDDFGTGYSNLENLREFPFSELKIDRSFIQNADTDPFAKTCVETSVSLGKNLGLKIVAEGVETAGHLKLAAKAGVDQIQGYYFSKPLPPEGFMRWCLDHPD